MFEFILNHNLTGFFGFTWVSQVISAIIASERCFCVVSPLRSQNVLSTRTMAVIIVSVFVIISGLFFLVVVRYQLVCVYDPVTDVYFKMIDGGEFYYKHEVSTGDNSVRLSVMSFDCLSYCPLLRLAWFGFSSSSSFKVLNFLKNLNVTGIVVCPSYV